MIDDPIVAAVRKVREELARECNYDVHLMFEEMRKREALLGKRLIPPPPRKIQTESSASSAEAGGK